MLSNAAVEAFDRDGTQGVMARHRDAATEQKLHGGGGFAILSMDLKGFRSAATAGQ